MKKSCNNCIHADEGVCYTIQAPYASEISGDYYCEKWEGSKKTRLCLWLRQLGRDIAEALRSANA